MSDGNIPPSNPSDGGSTPPPPPPYGSEPPATGGPASPPPPPAYGAPGGNAAPYSPTDAIGYGWNKFKDNAQPMVLITLCIAGVIAGVMAVMFAIMAAAGAFSSSTSSSIDNCDPNSSDYLDCLMDQSNSAAVSTGFSFGLMLLWMVGILLAILASLYFQAAAYKGALMIADGQKPSLGDMFKGWSKGGVLGTMALMWVIVMVGMMICYIPGIIASFLLMLTPMYAVDNQGGSITDPLKRSFEVVKNNVGPMIIFWLLTMVVIFIGEILCGVGLLVAFPVVMIAQAYTARKLEGREVAA